MTAADLPKGRGKPLPDIFLRAAAVAGVDASHCVAYEAAEAGLKSAWAAGCAVVDVTGLPDYPLPEGLRAAKAAQVQRRDWLPPSRILVTGGTRGIGRAVVEALARREGREACDRLVAEDDSARRLDDEAERLRRLLAEANKRAADALQNKKNR